MSTPFAHVLHLATIARLAREVTLERGKAYAAEGRVRALERRGAQIVAAVQGGAFYAVSLRVNEAGLGYVCSCPSGAEGAFCKHCVAVAIAWTERYPSGGPVASPVALAAPLPTAAFANVLHRDTIAKLARGVTLERGREYAAQGRVQALARKGTQIVAAVRGESFYAVSLWLSGEGLGYICACPKGIDGDFCKHCVAVAFRWVTENPP